MQVLTSRSSVYVAQVVSYHGSMQRSHTFSFNMEARSISAAWLKEEDGIAKGFEDEGKKHVWNEKFKFNVEYPGGEEHPQDKLIFRVMDKHKISEDEFVGEAT
ncbi:hypothetical protein RJ639_007046 [Escallonia herrerae]|uniref:C2 domain-containing protein n=1 Tax=Escallonia herrerae TaxID=1293975 RepID=A0AA88VZH9_9ASTE|nr:hypothetical protein RJ639_007046 [Escallonia herrerae]